MLPRNPLAAMVLLTTTLISSSGCQKFLDVDFFNHGHEDAKLCTIQSIKCSGSLSDYVATFKYNAKGDPESVSFPDEKVSTGRPNLKFLYDKEGRISDYFGPYNNGWFEFWYHYKYQGNKIVGDTSYFNATYTANKPTVNPHGGYFASNYEYDVYDRIVRIVTKNLLDDDEDDRITTYTYNNHGNLSHFDNGSYSIDFPDYDGNTNIHRTHAVWMLVDRDYSVNNPYTAASYNGSHLPVSINLSTQNHTFLWQMNIDVAEITYQCK